MILGIVRHVLTGLGGAAVTAGYLSAETMTQAIGAVVTLAGVIWSLAAKKK